MTNDNKQILPHDLNEIQIALHQDLPVYHEIIGALPKRVDSAKISGTGHLCVWYEVGNRQWSVVEPEEILYYYLKG